MILRQFNESGIEEFRRFLTTCRERPDTALPNNLLEDPAYSQAISPAIEVERRQFKTKGDAARYFQEILAPLDDQEVSRNSGLWTWLSLLLFDEVCPRKSGKRAVRNDYSYIYEPNNMRHFYRHLLFIAWKVLQVAPTHNRLFLSGSLAKLDKATSETMKRLYVTRIPCVFEVLDRLYWDTSRQRIRSGVVSVHVSAGDLIHRFPVRIRQLEMTYDLQSLSADQLIDLLGDEFRQHEKPKAAASSAK